MIGVTGTNGKTTVTQLLGDLLTATGRPTNVMGTLSGARTTPEATEIQRVLAGVRDRQRSDGARHAVAMEVSSHALVQSRVEGIHFDVGVFTNLSHDHLDYHGTMEAYFEAKAMLFTPGRALARRRQRGRSVGTAAPRTRPHPDGRRQPCGRHRHRAAGGPHRVHLARPTDHDSADRRRQRRQRPPGGGGGARPRGAPARARGDRTGHGQPLAGPGPAADHRRAGATVGPGRPGPGTGCGRRRRGSPFLHRARRLRAHAGGARGGAGRGSDSRAGRAGAERLRVRWEPGQGQAPRHGRAWRRA